MNDIMIIIACLAGLVFFTAEVQVERKLQYEADDNVYSDPELAAEARELGNRTYKRELRAYNTIYKLPRGPLGNTLTRKEVARQRAAEAMEAHFQKYG